MSLSACVALLGCAVEAPAPPRDWLPAAKPDTGRVHWQRASAGSPAVVDARWWARFNDPVLDELQGRVLSGNLDLPQYMARVASAQAVLDASRGAMAPTLSAGLGGTRSDSVTSAHRAVSTLSLGLDAQWEADLWGRLSLNSQAAKASLEAAQDDLAATRLSVQSSLTRLYIELRSAQVQQRAFERNVRTMEQTFHLTSNRYREGMASRADALQAEAQLHAAQAQLMDASLQEEKYGHAIAVLLGLSPDGFTIEASGRLPSTFDLPSQLPSVLMERRPDIAAAERRVAAAYAQMGVADAAYFPALTLSASAGGQGSALRTLLEAPGRFWSIGPSLAMAVFDGGARDASRRQARANADGAVAFYRQLVLTAFQEVSDNLAEAEKLREELALQQLARDAAAHALEITLNQYHAGTVAYLNVLTAQSILIGSEINVVDVQRRELQAVAQLLKNNGGQW